MRRFCLLIIVFPIFLFSSPFSQITPVTGFGISYEEFHFFVSEPKTLAFEEMKFTVVNHESEAMIVNVSYDPIQGVNVSVDLGWKSIILEPGSSAINRYKIRVYEQFNITFLVEISAIGFLQDRSAGQKIIGGGIVTNYVTYFSNETAHFMDLNIVDQANRPRNADVMVYHKSNDSPVFTPMKKFNSSRIAGYFPVGWYRIFARDLEYSHIFVEEQFYLDNSSKIFLTLKMVGFIRFEPISDDKNHLGINLTITNLIDELYEVEIFAELFLNGKKLDTTFSKGNLIPVLHKVTNHPMKIWFNYQDWEYARYEVIGYIYSLNQLIATKRKYVQLDISQDDDVISAIPPELFLLVGAFVGISGYVLVDKWLKKRSEKKIEKMLDFN